MQYPAINLKVRHMAISLMVLAGAPLFGVALLNTTFANISTDTVPVDGTSRSVGSSSDWVVSNASQLDLVSVTSFTAGSTVYGTVGDPVGAGEWITMLGDGSYDSAGINATTRINTGGDVNLQLNSSTVGRASQTFPLNTAIFTFAFEVKAGNSVSGLSAVFDMGTGTTSGGWYVPSGGDKMTDNGYYNVRIVGVGNATDFTFYGTPQLGNTAPEYFDSPHVANAVNQGSQVLAAGTYRLEIILSNDTLNQRFTIDDFTLYGTVPEPAFSAVLTGFGALLLLIYRRKRLN